MSHRLIIDKNVAQSEPKTAPRIGSLLDAGATLVLTDTLVFEICSGDRPQLWQSLLSKICRCPDQIEVWKHTASLLRSEIANGSPVESPVDLELTDRLQGLLRAGNESWSFPHNISDIVAASEREREADSYEALVRALLELASDLKKYHREIRELTGSGDRDSIDQRFTALLQDQRAIHWICKRLYRDGDGYLIAGLSNDTPLSTNWFAYHDAASFLSLACLYMAKHEPSETPGEQFINTYHDSNYLSLCWYSDALVSNETSGDFSRLFDWTYPEKPRFSSQDIDQALPNERDLGSIDDQINEQERTATIREICRDRLDILLKRSRPRDDND